MKVDAAFLKFCAIGCVGLVVDVAVLYLLAPLFGWHGGRAASFLCAATTTWALNRTYTFGSAQGHKPARAIAREYLTYLLSMLVGGAINFLVYGLVVQAWSSQAAPAAGVALGSVSGLFVNFLLSRHVVFKR